jgi:molybdopterin-containing oxidoreductase family iron-sulfur binding subunit
MAACPYQRRFFNWGTPELPPEAESVGYSPLYPVPAVKGTVIKCMFCAHFLEAGRLPFCVTGCPMKALYMGDLNQGMASNGVEVVALSRFLDENDAFRYKEDLGTKPRVWYLPGHGQAFGRQAHDEREMKPPLWNYGDEGYERKIGVWPWDHTDKWTWEASPHK